MELCPQCEHPWPIHDMQEGCYSGWAYSLDALGGYVLAKSGCECKLAHVEISPDSISHDQLELV